ncbi:MAG: T9SS type A sorting domain-containing protein, partial [Saprospiraceae bacterium]
NGEETGDGTDEETTDSSCEVVDVNQMFTSSVGNHNAYIYTPQPYGAVNNQFRYRPVGMTNWALTDQSTVYYRYLSNLSAGTAYEFQVRHECTSNGWSNYTASVNFTTTGSTANSKVSTTLPTPLTLTALQARNPKAYSIKLIPNALTVFPNPARNVLNISLDIPLQKGAQIQVFDRMGRALKSMKVAQKTQTLAIEVNDLLSGVYLIQVQTDGKNLTKRFMVL